MPQIHLKYWALSCMLAASTTALRATITNLSPGNVSAASFIPGQTDCYVAKFKVVANAGGATMTAFTVQNLGSAGAADIAGARIWHATSANFCTCTASLITALDYQGAKLWKNNAAVSEYFTNSQFIVVTCDIAPGASNSTLRFQAPGSQCIFTDGNFPSIDAANKGTQTIVVQASSWATVASPVSANLSCLSMFNAASGQAVGAGGVILGYSGGSWAEASGSTTLTAQDLVGCRAAASNKGWAGGGGGIILSQSAGSWSVQSAPGAASSQKMNSIIEIASNNVWAAGTSGEIINFDGTIWSSHGGAAGNTLNSIAGLSATDIWAVGNTGTIVHYNGSTWNLLSYTAGTQNLNSVFDISASDIWAVGDAGAAFHYNGTSWNSAPTGVTLNVNAVTFNGAGDGWAVGDGGLILRFTSSWAEFQDSRIVTVENLRSAGAVGTNDVWAMGSNGVILHYRGLVAAWTPTKTFTYSPTVTNTRTPAASPSFTASASRTYSPTSTPSWSPTATPTWSPTGTPAFSPSATPSVTPTASPSSTPTSTPSATQTFTPSSTPTGTPSVTMTSSPSVTPSSSPTATASATLTSSPSATPSSTQSATRTATPTDSPTPTVSPTISATFTISETHTVSPTPAPGGDVRVGIYTRSGALILDLGLLPGYGPASSFSASQTRFEPETQASISFADDQGRVWVFKGQDASGKLLPNGVYLARLSQSGSANKDLLFSIEHAVDELGALDFVINPAKMPAAAFGLSLKPGVRAFCRLYNNAGELAAGREVFAPRDAMPLLSSGGQPLASGLYVMVIDLDGGQGRQQQIVRKLAVLP